MFVNLFNEPVGLAVLQEVLAQDLPVHGRSSVLRHHDDGSSEGGLCTHEEVRQDEWVVIPVGEPRNSVEREPDRQEGGLPDDELPGSHNVREHVCCALPPSYPTTHRCHLRTCSADSDSPGRSCAACSCPWGTGIRCSGGRPSRCRSPIHGPGSLRTRGP